MMPRFTGWRVGLALPVLALLCIAILVLMALPRLGAPLAPSRVASGSTTRIATPTNDDATSTISPQTPVSGNPTITPPPTPSTPPVWRTLGQYHGIGPTNNVATFSHVRGDLRVQWTCSVPGVGGTTHWMIGFVMMDLANSDNNSAMSGVCGAGGATKGTFYFSVPTPGDT